MITRTKQPRAIPVPEVPEKKKRVKKEKKEKKKKPIKKRALRCKDCRHFLSSPAKYLTDDRDRKGLFRICNKVGDRRQIDSTICPFFEVAEYIFCVHSEQWVHHKACVKRYHVVWHGEILDNKCTRRCGVGRELTPYLDRIKAEIEQEERPEIGITIERVIEPE